MGSGVAILGLLFLGFHAQAFPTFGSSPVPNPSSPVLLATSSRHLTCLSVSEGDGADSNMAGARDALEALFSSSSEEADNPLPANAAEGVLEATAAVKAALLSGKRGLIVDIEVAQFDADSQGFDEEELFRFAGELANKLTFAGKVKALFRTRAMASRASDFLQLEMLTKGTPLGNVGFGGLYPETPPTRDLDYYQEAAKAISGELSEDDKLLLLVRPAAGADVVVVRSIIELADGRPVVVFNPRFRSMPRELRDYTTAYQLYPYQVVPVKYPRGVAKSETRPNPATSKAVFADGDLLQAQPNMWLPKVVSIRRYPDPWQLFLDVDGSGYKEEATFDRAPSMALIISKAQRTLDKFEREVKRQVMERKKKFMLGDNE